MLRFPVLSVALTTGSFLAAQSINATVAPTGGGAPVAVTIGKLEINPGPNGVMKAEFKFAGPSPGTGFPGGFGFLDQWYDFRWIQMVTGYTDAAGMQVTNAAGQPIAPGLGVLPAMDPQPMGFPGGDDDEPFYYNAGEWASGMFGTDPINMNAPGPGAPVSQFVDMRINHPVGTVITFECYLVVRSITDPAIAPNEIVVLDGFRWTHTSGGGPGGSNAAAFAGAIGPDAAKINMSMGMAGAGAGFPPVAGVGAWTALPSGLPPAGRTLRQCLPPLAWWQPYGSGCYPSNPLLLDLLGLPMLGSTVLLRTYNQFPNPSVGVTFVSPNPIYPGVDLGIVGAPGCEAYVDLSAAVPFVLFGTNLIVPLQVPNSPTLVGATLFGQTAWYDPIANPLGFRTSNGISINVGF